MLKSQITQYIDNTDLPCRRVGRPPWALPAWRRGLQSPLLRGTERPVSRTPRTPALQNLYITLHHIYHHLPYHKVFNTKYMWLRNISRSHGTKLIPTYFTSWVLLNQHHESKVTSFKNILLNNTLTTYWFGHQINNQKTEQALVSIYTAIIYILATPDVRKAMKQAFLLMT